VSVPLFTTPQADGQIREIDAWWRANRAAAPDLFFEELTKAFKLIEEAPYIGRLYRKSPVRNTRRLLLSRTRYHVYYVPLATEVWVLAVWHAQRGAGPPLRAS